MKPRLLRRLKRAMLAALFALLLLPPIQTWLNIKFLKSSLDGYEVRIPKPKLSWAAVRSSTYQDSLERYLTEGIGLRERFIRPRNQIAYLLFGQTQAKQIVFGKDGVLFEDRPINAYMGQDAVSEDEVRSRVQQLKALQDSLARRGKLLVLAVAPSKPFVYPEYLPDEALWRPRQPSNYERYLPHLQASALNFIDLNALFRQWKDTASFPLFPRGGTHWSGYGATLAADTLFRYLEQRGGFDLPDFYAAGREETTRPRYTDNDLVRTMNLLWNPREFRMAYPNVQFAAPKPGQRRPRLLVVGDSFVWALIEFYPYIPSLFSPHTHFWYYNREVQWTGTTPSHHVPEAEYDVTKLDHRAELARHDVVLVLLTAANLGAFDYGFSEETLRALAAP